MEILHISDALISIYALSTVFVLCPFKAFDAYVG